MEAISISSTTASVYKPNSSHEACFVQNPVSSAKPLGILHNKPIGCLKINASSHLARVPTTCCSLTPQVSDEGKDEDESSTHTDSSISSSSSSFQAIANEPNISVMCCHFHNCLMLWWEKFSKYLLSSFNTIENQEIACSFGVDSNQEHNRGRNLEQTLKMEMPLSVPYGSGTRAGLFRTPISGGVQSATSAHGLPRPALAVRNLMEQARFAHLCTVMSRMHHRREGYPFGSLVDFAPDSMGHPIFSFSPLAIHTRNLLADPRCTLVVQIPGWSGLSNARVTIFGDVYPLPEHQQDWAHKQYISKHQQGPSQQWGNFYYFRMQNISDIYFIGGFGTVAWVDVKEYETLQPDKIAVEGGEQYLKELNLLFSKPLKELLSTESEVDDACLISIDSKGIDIRVRQGAQFNVQRISFEEGHAVETLEEAKSALHKLINRGRVPNFQ